MNNGKRSGEHQRYVEELRRSNAAGTHGEGKYTRRTKYPVDYKELLDDFDEESEGEHLV